MSDSRISRIEDAASEGNLSNLKEILETGFRQIEIDAGLVCAVAYSHVEVGEYLLCLGADLSYDNNSAAYYAVHNNQIEGLKFAVKNGVNVNANNGHLLNEAVVTAFNQKDLTILTWLLERGAKKTMLTKSTMKHCATPEIKRVVNKYTRQE